MHVYDLLFSPFPIKPKSAVRHTLTADCMGYRTVETTVTVSRHACYSVDMNILFTIQ